MKLLMCCQCGHFEPATFQDGTWVAIRGACSQCDGESFEDVSDR